jgi:hypothetical protein
VQLPLDRALLRGVPVGEPGPRPSTALRAIGLWTSPLAGLACWENLGTLGTSLSVTETPPLLRGLGAVGCMGIWTFLWNGFGAQAKMIEGVRSAGEWVTVRDPRAWFTAEGARKP